MKIEKRGKYAGVKLHLDREECLKTTSPNPFVRDGFLLEIFEMVRQAIKEDPTILNDRSEEEIHAALSKEAIESKLKLEKLGKKEDWKKVKVEVKA